ncbi:MAG: thiamine pyrophosphate-binding protein, partial [Dehalococcoidia bacterium]
LTKWTVRAQTLETLPHIMSRALNVATTGSPGPVAVIVPGPLWAAESEFNIVSPTEVAHYPASRTDPGVDPIQRAAALLIAAEKPAIVAGGGIMLSRASEQLIELAERSGAPVATTHVAHGSFPSSHPLSLGVLGNPNAGNRGRIANKIVGEADVVLLVGTRMDAATTRGHTLLSPNAQLIQIDIDPQQIGSNYPVEVGIVADANLALQALTRVLAEKVSREPVIADSARAGEIAAMMEEWREEFNPQMTADSIPIKTPRLFKEIQECIGEDTIVVVDAGSSSYWAPAYLELTPENHALYPRGAAALGSGFPMAAGAQAAAPDKKVVCISGDGAFGYNIMELETVVRLNLPVVNIVVNNQTLGMEHRGYLQYAGEIPPEATYFSPQDFSKIAQAYGCLGVRVESPGELRGAITAALASGRPAVIDVVTDREDSDSEATRPWRSY